MRARARLSRPEGENNLGWLITYMDLITLLLAFFVLVMSLSAKDSKRSRSALGSVADAFMVASSAHREAAGKAGDGTREASDFSEEPLGLDEVQRLVAAHASGLQDVEVLEEGGKTVVRLPARVLFMPAATEVSPAARDFLSAVAGGLKLSSDLVDITGHSDRLESIDNPHWPNNPWELSARRAQVVYDFLRGEGIEAARMSARGVGSNRPVVDSASSPGLHSENARVEIAFRPAHPAPSRTGADRAAPKRARGR